MLPTNIPLNQHGVKTRRYHRNACICGWVIICRAMVNMSPCCCDCLSSCFLSHQPDQQHLCECLQVDLSPSNCLSLTVSPRSLWWWWWWWYVVVWTLVVVFNSLLLGAFAVRTKPVPDRNHSGCKRMRWWLMQLGRHRKQPFSELLLTWNRSVVPTNKQPLGFGRVFNGWILLSGATLGCSVLHVVELSRFRENSSDI